MDEIVFVSSIKVLNEKIERINEKKNVSCQCNYDLTRCCPKIHFHNISDITLSVIKHMMGFNKNGIF